MEEEGVGARGEAAAGVLVDGRVRAASREGEREREHGEARAGASPRLPHREGTSGRRRRRRVQVMLSSGPGNGRFEALSRWRWEPMVKVGV